MNLTKWATYCEEKYHINETNFYFRKSSCEYEAGNVIRRGWVQMHIVKGSPGARQKRTPGNYRIISIKPKL